MPSNDVTEKLGEELERALDSMLEENEELEKLQQIKTVIDWYRAANDRISTACCFRVALSSVSRSGYGCKLCIGNIKLFTSQKRVPPSKKAVANSHFEMQFTLR